MVLNKALGFRMKDAAMKVIYVQNNQLLARRLQEGRFIDVEEISVVPSRSLDAKQFPIILGIKGGYQCLSGEIAQQPVLQLKEKNMDLYCNKEESKNFTFYMQNPGIAFKLESTIYPGCFLCSTLEENQPITLTNHPEKLLSAITEFYFQKCY